MFEQYYEKLLQAERAKKMSTASSTMTAIPIPPVVGLETNRPMEQHLAVNSNLSMSNNGVIGMANAIANAPANASVVSSSSTPLSLPVSSNVPTTSSVTGSYSLNKAPFKSRNNGKKNSGKQFTGKNSLETLPVTMSVDITGSAPELCQNPPLSGGLEQQMPADGGRPITPKTLQEKLLEKQRLFQVPEPGTTTRPPNMQAPSNNPDDCLEVIILD